MSEQNMQEEFEKQWNEICKMKEQISTKNRKIIDEMINENEDMDKKKQKIMNEIMKGMSEKDKEIGKLKKEIRTLKMKMAKMESDLKAHNISIHRRKMPIELMNELFGSLPFENAFGLLAKMPNGLLARKVQKMINGIKMAMKKNILNVDDCGPKIIISEDGLVAKHSGSSGWNVVRAVFPIPQFNFNNINKTIIVFYFVIQIINKPDRDENIVIGFCDQQFSKCLGRWKNTIGIFSKRGIEIDGSWNKFQNDGGSFNKGEFLGLGIIYSSVNSKMECFVTWNGKLQVKAEWPEKFFHLQLFPAVNFYFSGQSIRANFKKEEWTFKEFEHILE